LIQGTNPLLPDTDGDGALDGVDAFPTDPSEQQDTDHDGIGNNEDPDDDNDGVPDVEDPAPLNPAIPSTPAAPPQAPAPALPEPLLDSARPADPIRRVQTAPEPEPIYQQEEVSYTFLDESSTQYTIPVRIAKSRKNWNTWEFEMIGASAAEVMLWDFGDNTAGQEQQETHVFRGHGDYTVTLTIHDNSGGIGYAHTDVSIGFWNIGNPWVMAMIGVLAVIVLALSGMLLFDAVPPLRFF